MVLGCLLVLLCWVRALLVLCFFWLFFLLRAILLGSCGAWSLVFGCGFVGDLACLFLLLYCVLWWEAFPLGLVFFVFSLVFLLIDFRVVASFVSFAGLVLVFL